MEEVPEARECGKPLKSGKGKEQILPEMGFHHVGQAGFELLTSGDPPASCLRKTGVQCRIMAHCNLRLPGPSHSLRFPSSCNYRCVPPGPGLHHVGQAGLKLLSTDDPPTLASQSPGITENGLIYKGRRLHIFKVLNVKTCTKDVNFSTVFCLFVFEINKQAGVQWILTLLPRLECSGTISVHCNLCHPGSKRQNWLWNEVLLRWTPWYNIMARHGLTLSPRLECSGKVIAHYSPELLSSSNPPTLASQITGTTGFCHVDQAALELLTSSDLPTLASQSSGVIAGITGVHQYAQLIFVFLVEMAFHHVDQDGLYLLTSVLLLLFRLEFNGTILAHQNLHLPGSSDSPALASQIAESLSLSSRLECSVTMSAHHNFRLPGSKFRSCCLGWSAMSGSWLTTTSAYRISASQVQAILLPQPPSSWDYRHVPPCPANFVFLVEMGFLHVGQAGLELPTSERGMEGRHQAVLDSQRGGDGEDQVSGENENQPQGGDTRLWATEQKGTETVEAAGSSGSRARNDFWREFPREGEIGATRSNRRPTEAEKGRKTGDLRGGGGEGTGLHLTGRAEAALLEEDGAGGGARGFGKAFHPRRQPAGPLHPALPLLTWESEANGGYRWAPGLFPAPLADMAADVLSRSSLRSPVAPVQKTPLAFPPRLPLRTPRDRPAGGWRP
ncbi:hypothetical protein AAY473_021040 [Plecturocebus cupreus]